jgi:hypothetical protein
MAKIEIDDSTRSICLDAIDRSTNTQQVEEAIEGLEKDGMIAKAADTKIESLR